ncbi:hypothetical protein HDU87_002359 [Geranomyces variabilis]|uniref:Aminotransferase n=1 Tax=Geranomyces variabilis TaxID=109894 RepID=A0AAD5TL02_9FUNG|nr:hypothetical protein HDU87_002359 [Geranomyces variabilis]
MSSSPIPPAVVIAVSFNDGNYSPPSDSSQLSTTTTPSTLSAPAFLLAHPPGGYTALQTAGGPFRPVALAAHIRRLCETVRKIYFTDEKTNNDNDNETDGSTGVRVLREWSNEETAARPLVELMQRAARAWVNADPARRNHTGFEVKITVLVALSKETGLIVAAHCDELHKRALSPTRVLVAGAPRVNPTAKGSQWVRTRAPLQAALTPPYTECILTDAAHNLYEGLTSNFCVLALPPDTTHDPYVACASAQYILMGTILQIVIDGCKELGVTFRWQFPNVADHSGASETAAVAAAGGKPVTPSSIWGGAFIASTTRGVLPIEEIAFPDGR